VAGISEEMAAALSRERPALTHSSTAGRVTDILRTHITQGLLPPGTRLSEEAIGRALGVSRNTLREAFALLSHERLAVHHMNRGVFVPTLTREDVSEIYTLRRLVEGGAARLAGTADPAARQAVGDAVDSAETYAAAGQWLDVRTEDLRFHQAIAGLAGSSRVDELMRRALAELRLIFHVMESPEEFHRPYLERNRSIAESVMRGDGKSAERELLRYLADAEAQILASYNVPALAADGHSEVPAH
jgi:DNA-binding GntR family transcriptional regulator